jgi:hypothetical protein
LDGKPPVVENKLDANHFSHDIEAIIEQIWHTFKGATSREEIREMVAEAASEYEDVRIRTYVPIFVHRDVIQRLRNVPDRRQSGEVPDAYNKSAASPSISARQERIAQVELFENLGVRLSEPTSEVNGRL